MWYSRSYAWMRKQAADRRDRALSQFDVVFELVTGTVHPGNLQALPPSPDVILYKASQIGLMTMSELVMGTVHPGNLQALPPSPDVTLYKAS